MGVNTSTSMRDSSRWLVCHECGGQSPVLVMGRCGRCDDSAAAMVDSIIDERVVVAVVKRVDPLAALPAVAGQQTLRRNPRPHPAYETVYGEDPEPVEVNGPPAAARVAGVVPGYPVGEEPAPPPGSLMPIGSRRVHRRKVAEPLMEPRL